MRLSELDMQDPAEWKTMFDVNVIGLMNGMQAVLAPMKARNTGTIINISSIAGRKTFPSHAAYCGAGRNLQCMRFQKTFEKKWRAPMFE